MEEFSGVKLQHVNQYSFDAHRPGQHRKLHRRGAGPDRLCRPSAHQRRARPGEFLIPMATTEGTLVASYNRGMKVMNLSGGVEVHGRRGCHAARARSSSSRMRAPRAISRWVQDNFAAISDEAEATSSVAKLLDIEPYLSRQVRLPALQLHHRRCRRAEHGRPRHVRRVQLDPGSLPRHPALLPRIELRHRQEGVADQHHAHARQARHRRGDDPARRADPAHARRARRASPTTTGVANVGAFLSGVNNNGLHSANAHHGDVHRHRAGRGQRRPSRRRASCTSN